MMYMYVLMKIHVSEPYFSSVELVHVFKSFDCPYQPTGAASVSSRMLLCKVWFGDQQHWLCPGACWKCRTSSLFPDLWSQNLHAC